MMNDSSRNDQIQTQPSMSPQSLTIRSGDKQSGAGANQQALGQPGVGGQPALPSSIDYILSLAFKQHQHQQLLQHQRHLQQLQHLQNLQQIQQQPQTAQAPQMQQQHRQQASVAAAAAAAAALQHHHIQQQQQQQQQHQQQQQQQQQPQHHHHQHQSQSHHRRQYNPAATLHYLATNECRVIDYRGHRIAAFLSTPNPAMLHHLHRSGQTKTGSGHSEHLLCLPQAFEVFLKHLVGGLHTVYTKLKRLDIVPIVCNVEQVRILRGLGAIQPGVNRCKLLSTHDFDILFKDCTTARLTSNSLECSTRPGRPPKRSPVGDMMSSASESPTRDDSRVGTPSPSLDSTSSVGGTNSNLIRNNNAISSSSSSSNNNNNNRPNSRETQQNLNNYDTSCLVGGLSNAATNALLNGSSLINNNNNNNNSGSCNNSTDSGTTNQQLDQQQSIDFSALAQATNTEAVTPTGTSGATNSLNALLDTSLLASKLAQQHQQLLGGTGGGTNCTSSNPNSLLNNNGTNSSPLIPNPMASAQAMQAASNPNPLSTVANPFAGAGSPTHPGINQAAAAAAAAAAANMYLSPNILNDVWLLLALVQQQLNQQLQAPGRQSNQLLQQQLQAHMQLLQQQQQQNHHHHQHHHHHHQQHQQQLAATHNTGSRQPDRASPGARSASPSPPRSPVGSPLGSASRSPPSSLASSPAHSPRHSTERSPPDSRASNDHSDTN